MTMANKRLIVALGLMVAASPLAASQDSMPAGGGAPAAGPDARYCMRVEAVTGSRIETVRCWTRWEWAEQGVDVDRDWAKEGVAVQG
jgi:hypothetical protein